MTTYTIVSSRWIGEHEWAYRVRDADGVEFDARNRWEAMPLAEMWASPEVIDPHPIPNGMPVRGYEVADNGLTRVLFHERNEPILA